MDERQQHEIEALLASERPEDIHEGLSRVKREIARHGSEEARPYFEMLTTLFYIDPLDRPDLLPMLEEAITLLVGLGGWVIPSLVEKLDAGDMKAQIAISHALGRLGADAIGPLMEAYHASDDPSRQAFILYAMGKIKAPKIVDAATLAIAAAQDPDLELRDTATRAIGKFVESIDAIDLGEGLRRELAARLQANLADESSGIRAKAVRSLGKMARHGFLTADEKEALRAAFLRILGKDEAFAWDRAYLVRREAEEALSHLD